MRQRQKREEGVSLVSVMVGIIIMVIMTSAFIMANHRSTAAVNSSISGSRALMYARSGMQSVYHQMHVQWDGDASTNNAPYPNGIWSTVAGKNAQTVELALKQTLLSNMQSWIQSSTANNSYWKASIAPDGDNFPQSSSNPTSNLYQRYKVTVTGTDVQGGTSFSVTLTDDFTISGSFGAYGYAIYTPADLFVTGAPEFSGSIVVGHTTYFDETPWYWTNPSAGRGHDNGGGNDYSNNGNGNGSNSGNGKDNGFNSRSSPSYWFLSDPVRLVDQSESSGNSQQGQGLENGSGNGDHQDNSQDGPIPGTFTQEPSGAESLILPRIDPGSSWTTNSIASFSLFEDQSSSIDPTQEYGASSHVTSPILVSPANVSSVVQVGNHVTGPVAPTSQVVSSGTVQVVNQMKGDGGTSSPIFDGYSNVDTLNHGHLGDGNLPTTATYIHDEEGQAFQYSANESIDEPLYYSGNALDIMPGASLTLKAPMFIDGNLYVDGQLTSDGSSPQSLYVNGDVTIGPNLANDSHLEIYATGNIYFDDPQSATAASESPVDLYVHLAAGQNLYVGGMVGEYRLHGGLCADRNIVVNSTTGAKQNFDTNSWSLASADGSDQSRRLQIVYDSWYLVDSVPQNFALQPMPAPSVN